MEEFYFNTPWWVFFTFLNCTIDTKSRKTYDYDQCDSNVQRIESLYGN